MIPSFYYAFALSAFLKTNEPLKDGVQRCGK